MGFVLGVVDGALDGAETLWISTDVTGQPHLWTGSRLDFAERVRTGEGLEAVGLWLDLRALVTDLEAHAGDRLGG